MTRQTLIKKLHGKMALQGMAVLLISMLPFYVNAQGLRTAGKQETATCQLSVVTSELKTPQTNKSKAVKSKAIAKTSVKRYAPTLNQLGYFEQVSNIQPLQNIPIEIAYPNGRPGDRVIVAVADGGTLDNKEKAKMLQLDIQKKLAFNFQAASDPGIYRIFLRKGKDTKVIRLWVGPEPLPVKN
ncbi:MAG: hypothetical protein ABIN01_01060 [Ferruginibacter sp.]